MQSGKQPDMMVDRRIPEMRYAYYRRCQQFRRNGHQCKAPALKDGYICYQHAEQAATARRRQESLRALRLPGQFNDFNSIQRAISIVAQALIDDRIDSKAAGRVAIELQNASIRLRKRFTTETRRYGERQRSCDLVIARHRVIGKPANTCHPERANVSTSARIPTPVILSAAPRQPVAREAEGRRVEASRRCFASPCGIKAFSKELPDTAFVMQTLLRSFDSPSSRRAELGLAQDDRRSCRNPIATVLGRAGLTRRSPDQQIARKNAVNHREHLISPAPRFSSPFSPHLWHNGSSSGVLSTLVEVVVSIEGRNTL